MDQQTPLYTRHQALKGTIVPFGGFLLPVQYPTGILTEHKAVRQAAGLFDVSHMGEALIQGPAALENLNALLTNTFDTLSPGSCRYTLMLYETGGCVDDLIVYRLGEQAFLLVLNASNTEKDIAWLRAHLTGDVTLTDLSPRTAQLALQGPDAKKILASLTDEARLPAKYYTFTEHVPVAGADCLISRTGYTGEHGYELYLDPAQVGEVWDALLAAGAIPCGLGARDTLRLEAGMPLYGHEIDEDTDPLTAGLQFAVKMDHDFVGKAALTALGAPTRRRVGLQVTGRGVVREHQPVFLGDTQIGVTTSGTFCPHLGVSCAMAYLDADNAELGQAVDVEVRGRRVPCQVVALPFYNRAK